MQDRKYTHTDAQGIRWRFEGSRPVSEIADTVMDKVFAGKRDQKQLHTKTKHTKARKYDASQQQ